MSGIVEKALIFAKVCHDGDSSGHDFEHIRRVLTNAEKIAAETSEADVEIVRLAAILHDVDDYKLNNGEARADGFCGKPVRRTMYGKRFWRLQTPSVFQSRAAGRNLR